MDGHYPMLFASVLDPEHLLTSLGTIGLIVIIFLESCFAPLPGDSLLFSAGIFASAGKMNLGAILVGTAIAAIAGNQVGYWLGRRMGPSLFSRPDSRWLKQENIQKTEAYFAKYGARTILIARVVPIVRGLAPIVAGVGKMPYRTFVIYNIAGGIAWVTVFIMGGWLLGNRIDNVDRYVLPIAAVVVIVTSIPLYLEYRRSKKVLAGTDVTSPKETSIND